MLTNQEIFNRVWQHFIVEDKPYAYDTDIQLCSYLTKEGHQCAIGLFLTPNQASDLAGFTPVDRRFNPVAIEVFGRSVHIVKNEDDYDYRLNDFGRFLKKLQEAHDISHEARPPERMPKSEFESMLRLVAREFYLDIPSIQA